MSGSRQFLGFDRFFRLGVGLSVRAYRAKIATHGHDELTFMRGNGARDATFSAQWAMGGRTPSDFVGTTLTTPVLVSQRTKDIMEGEGVTGWVSNPCRVLSRDGDAYDYHLLGITGRSGPMKYERSERFIKKLPGGPANYLRGMYFDPETWDGADLFLAGDTVIKVTTDRVRELFSKYSVRNITLERLTEVEFGAIDVGLRLPAPTTLHYQTGHAGGYRGPR